MSGSSEARARHNRSIARIGGLSFAASHDGRAATESARAAFASSFETEVRRRFPELTDENEIRRRAAVLRRLHYCRLSYLSAEARRHRQASAPSDSNFKPESGDRQTGTQRRQRQ